MMSAMMELFQPLSIVCLLAVVAALLWKSRRDVAWFSPRQRRRLEVIDRVTLTHQHSVCLLRVEDRWMALAVTPKGVELLGSEAFTGEQSNPDHLSFQGVLRSTPAGLGKGAAG